MLRSFVLTFTKLQDRYTPIISDTALTLTLTYARQAVSGCCHGNGVYFLYFAVKQTQNYCSMYCTYIVRYHFIEIDFSFFCILVNILIGSFNELQN